MNPNPYSRAPSGFERTIQRQREKTRVRTLTRPVMITGVSNIYTWAERVAPYENYYPLNAVVVSVPPLRVKRMIQVV